MEVQDHNQLKTEEAKYRGPVQMSGWVLKFQSKMRYRRLKRYFKLNNSILSNHRSLTTPATWEQSVSSGNVKSDEEHLVVTIRLKDREIRFQLATVEQTRRWRDAIRAASQCNIDDFYEVGEVLGSGSFGTVYIGRDRVTGEKRAVKVVKRSSNAKEIEFLRREVNILLSVRHKNVVRTYDVFDERDKIYLVMDYVKGGDMAEYISRHVRLGENQTRGILKQILEGVTYLHNNNIVHRDIKLENILLTSINPILVQLTDFGFANFVDTNQKTETEMTSMVGTGTYVAPEVIDARGHGKPVDLYSVGVVAFRMISGNMPFVGLTLHECYLQAVSRQANFDAPEWITVSNECKHFCSSLLNPDPAKRPTANQALSHPWFGIDGRLKHEAQRTRNFGSHVGTAGIKSLRKLSIRLGSHINSLRSSIAIGERA